MARAAAACHGAFMLSRPQKKPEMSARQRRQGPTWYVLVSWGDWPSQQVGGFVSEVDARSWIAHESAGWLSGRYAEPPFV